MESLWKESQEMDYEKKEEWRKHAWDLKEERDAYKALFEKSDAQRTEDFVMWRDSVMKLEEELREARGEEEEEQV